MTPVYGVHRLDASGRATGVAVVSGRHVRLTLARARRLAQRLNETRPVAGERWAPVSLDAAPRQRKPGEAWTNRLGSVVLVVDNRDGSFDSEGGGPGDPATTPRASNPWASVCDTHHTYVMHDSRALAFAFARHSDEWCEACREAADCASRS